MAANMFLQISDIPGQATEKNHDKWIVIRSMDWGVDRMVNIADMGGSQRGHANSTFRQVSIQSELDIQSTPLMTSVANGTVRPEIVIHCCRSGESASEGLQEYLVITLKHAIVDSYSVGMSEDMVPVENITIAYTEVVIEYKSTDQKTGKLKKENEFKWNLQKGDVS